MSKIPTNELCELDRGLYALFDKIDPVLFELGVTPNLLTLGSVTSACLSIYAFYKEKYLESGGLFVLAQIFDAHDGYFARKYNMVSNLGDWFDHVTDVVSGIGLITVLFYSRYRFNKYTKLALFAWVVLLVFIAWFQVSCVEKKYHESAKGQGPTANSDTLKFLPRSVRQKDCDLYFGSKLRHINITTVSLLYAGLCILIWIERRHSKQL